MTPKLKEILLHFIDMRDQLEALAVEIAVKARPAMEGYSLDASQVERVQIDKDEVCVTVDTSFMGDSSHYRYEFPTEWLWADAESLDMLLQTARAEREEKARIESAKAAAQHEAHQRAQYEALKAMFEFETKPPIEGKP